MLIGTVPRIVELSLGTNPHFPSILRLLPANLIGIVFAKCHLNTLIVIVAEPVSLTQCDADI
jgi:hypothetical protein